MFKAKVISIASVSGGGKTTVTNELIKRINCSEALFFDEYDFEGAPDDLVKWVDDGPDYNQWNLELLKAELKSLLEREEPPEYIILDYPFAYKNDQLKNFIDLSIYIDTPLDIAMARRFLRDQPNTTSYEISDQLNFYLKFGREAYLEMGKTIKPNSDLIVDGSLPVIDIVDTILETVKT
ncbi:hypothetical protein [Guptibacillus hwajinpoensis]|uniref:Phosphoribulokinase/uridine kinase domain-containing protein n=1 Tax=Guptibacillus hwajinpoensis TaxID=208199 RepID=A0A0J6CQA9_9BACL|nr:hypothetical protein [Alkalihalobacillus macyae]KMM38446.1 hypothetical protein AB986_03880 [Alkalihalobacillus macyae]